MSHTQLSHYDQSAFAVELGVLSDIVASHRDSGQGALVLIGAPRGISSLGLVRHLTERADGPRLELVHLRCTGPVPPFGPLIEMERVLHPRLGAPRARTGGDEGDAAPRLRAGGAPLPRFVSSLVQQQLRELHSAGRYGLLPRDLRQRAAALHHGFARLFEEVPTPVDQPPRAVLLEDVHTADEDTIELLTRMSAPPLGVGCVIFACYRSDVSCPSLDTIRANVDSLSARDGRFVHLRLRAWELSDARTWLSQRFDAELAVDDGNVMVWLGAVNGHPGRFRALVEELVRTGALRQSRKRGWVLGDAYSTRPLPSLVVPYDDPALLRPALRATLRRAAVLGRRFSPALLARIEGREETAVLEDFQAAQDEGHRFVEADRETLVFVHEETPRLLRDELLPPLRCAYAAKAASVLLKAQGQRRETGLARIHPGRIALLREMAEQPAEALGAHLQAARQDQRLLALRSAAGHLRRTRALWAQGYRPSREDADLTWQVPAELGQLLLAHATSPTREGKGERRAGLQRLGEAVAAADAAEADVRERAQLRVLLALALSEDPVSRAEALNQLRRARTLLVVGGRPDEAWRYARREAELQAVLDDLVGAMTVFQAAIRYFQGDGADLPFAKMELGWLMLRAAQMRRPQVASAPAADREGLRKAVLTAVDEALQLFRELSDDEGVAEALTERAALLRNPVQVPPLEPEERERLLGRCVRTLEEALALRKEHYDLAGIAATRRELGDTFAELDRREEAAAQYLAAGLALLSLDGGGVQDIFDRFPLLGGEKAARARAQLETAAGIAPTPPPAGE